MTDHDNAVTRLFYEAGHLKRTPRTGWYFAGVPKADVESVAEHSFRTAIIAYVLASIDGADAERAATLAVFHDTQESRTGDIPYVGKKYLNRPDHEKVTEHQTDGMPDVARDAIRELVGAYEAQESREAIIARDADKLECVLQGREYQDQGHGDCSDWIKSCTDALQTETAKRLAETAASMHAMDWWRLITGRP